jgi:MoaA/NifB/PqqE/SkfB family radical SAM enzyme
VGHEGVWTDRAPVPWDGRGAELRDRVRGIFAARRQSPALRRGDVEIAYAEEHTLVLRRAAEGDVCDVVIHAGDEAIEIDLDDNEYPEAELVASIGEVKGQGGALVLGPSSGAILRRRPAAARVADNTRVRDMAFEAAHPSAPVRPTRIDFAVTERCNLFCKHCITHAPQRTKDGSARTLTPFVLDRLRADLAYASYFGFVHGGESLTAPIFLDVLRALPRGAMVHLLTNGVKLGERTATEIVELGVRSISVSLDGATAPVNDAIRAGGRFETIVSNIRGLVRLRRRHRWDLRVGLSYVVMRSNTRELLPFVDLAADLGVDWIKLEEPVGSTPFALAQLVSPQEIERQVAAAVGRAEHLGMVAVDHTRPMPAWRCRLDRDGQGRLTADEFANRSEIHPCRSLWDLACVEPNGDVRLGEFFGPILGNVTERSLADLWRGPVAEAARQRAISERLCGRGPVTCSRAHGRSPSLALV